LVDESYINNDNQDQINEKAYVLLQSWWSMEGRHKKEKKKSSLEIW
jgi:hypothetical protein